MTQRTTRGIIATGVAAWLVLLAIVSWRAQPDEATQDQADAEAARLEKVARDSEDEVFSLRDATGATGDLPAFYERQWVPLIGVLAPAPEQKARRAAARKATNEELAPPTEFPKYGGEPTLREVLEEYAQGVPNFGHDPGGPTNPWAFYPLSFDVEQGPDYLEDQALFDSLSAGLRTQFQGAAAELFGAWKKEQERAEARRKRDEAEYAVFIEEHLRRRYGGSDE